MLCLGFGARIFLATLLIAGAAHGQTNASSWRELPNAPVARQNERFDDVFFLNPLIGWVVNLPQSKIFKTIDGGESWVELATLGSVF
jgi:photosystem II stability/assembly factor-like uncharacterized protein